MTDDSSATDTIVAISTPPGRGGIGIVRLSGPDALQVAGRLVSLEGPLEHARARLARVVDIEERGKTIDDAVVTAFLGPRSYTGETVVEIAAHGSPVVLEAMVRGALAEGARLGLAVRLARPGEFTQRAFLAGRIDLTQAEAVGDLIAAQTLEQARVAAQQMGGAMARQGDSGKGRVAAFDCAVGGGDGFRVGGVGRRGRGAADADCEGDYGGGAAAGGVGGELSARTVDAQRGGDCADRAAQCWKELSI